MSRTPKQPAVNLVLLWWIGDAVNFVYINDGDRLAQALEPKNNPLLQGPKLQTPKLQTPNIQSSPSVQSAEIGTVDPVSDRIV
jgi:hypothetical protein